MPKSYAAVGSVLVGAVLIVIGATPGGAQASANGFVGAATADGIRTIVTADGAPVFTTPYDGGNPVAQALFDPFGSSSAFGSVLYPGDAVVTLPGLIAGATHGEVAPPSYPLIAHADGITPEEEVVVPGSAMRASVSTERASGSASTGVEGEGGGTQIRAAASVGRIDGQPVASAETLVSGFGVPGLSLGEIRSQARVTMNADGELERASSFEIAPFSVGGLRVAVGEDGIELAGTNVPLEPGEELTEILEDALAPAGITLEFVPQEETPTGIISAGLRVVSEVETGAAVSSVQLTQLFGRTSASLAAGATFDPGSVPEVDLSTPVAAAPVPEPGNPTATALPSRSPATSPAPQNESDAAAPVVASPVAQQIGLLDQFDLRKFYLALVGVGLVLGGAGHLVREFGVRLRWS